MTVTNFNYEGSYLPGVICNIVVKGDLGRWTPQWIENRCLEHHYTKLGRQTYSGWWPPWELQIDALNTATPNLAGEPTLANGNPQMHYGIYIMGCIWQPCWILQEKMGISCYSWIIRVVNSLLTLYSHVICNPPQHPQNYNYKFQLWRLIRARFNM